MQDTKMAIEEIEKLGASDIPILCCIAAPRCPNRLF